MLFQYKDDKGLLDCLLKAQTVFLKFDKDSEEYKNHLETFSVDTMLMRYKEIIEAVLKDVK